MNLKPLPQRKSPRLKDYDYSQSGVYFVTICTHQRQLLFGTIENGEMKLDALGQIVHDTWQSIPQHKSTIELDYFVVMPNHFHGIILITDNIDKSGGDMANMDVNKNGGDTSPPYKSPTLGTIIGHFKAAVTRTANRQLQYETRIWQSSYHDHIIRNEKSLNYLRQYVIYNPAKWDEDTFYF